MNTVSLDVQDIKMDIPVPSHVDIPEYVPVDTSELQLEELQDFMERLGYNATLYIGTACEVCDCHWGNVTSVVGFYSDYKEFNRVSCATAIKFYKTDWILDENHVGHYRPLDPRMAHFHFPTTNVRAAVYGKMFCELKFQWAAKSKTFICYEYDLHILHLEDTAAFEYKINQLRSRNENNS